MWQLSLIFQYGPVAQNNTNALESHDREFESQRALPTLADNTASLAQFIVRSINFIRYMQLR